MAVVRSKDQCTAMVREAARKNATVAQTKASLRQQKNDERLERERNTIATKALRKREKEQRDAKVRQGVGVREAEEEGDDGIEPQALPEEGTFPVEDVDWPAYYGTTLASTLPEDLQGCVAKLPTSFPNASLATSSKISARGSVVRSSRLVEQGPDEITLTAVCNASITPAEVEAYILHSMPDIVSWGTVADSNAVGVEELVAYTAVKDISEEGTVMYEMRTKHISGSKTHPGRVRDTPASLLVQFYEPGMLLDAETLIAVLVRRVACMSNAPRFSDTQSYLTFERWITYALEFGDDLALAHTALVLSNNYEALDVYNNCVENNKPCEDDLVALIGQIRTQYWQSVP